MADLSSKKCIPCEEGTDPISNEESLKMLSSLNDRWELKDNGAKIYATVEFDDFKNALNFVNKVGDLAEKEGHHPDIKIYDYKYVGITLYTHKIGGLHENDFILAAKIDGLI